MGLDTWNLFCYPFFFSKLVYKGQMKIFVAYIVKINIQQNIINSSCRMTRASQTMLHPTWAIQWDLFCLHVYFEGTDTVKIDRHRSWWFISVSSYCMSQKNPIVRSSKMNRWGKFFDSEMRKVVVFPMKQFVYSKISVWYL